MNETPPREFRCKNKRCKKLLGMRKGNKILVYEMEIKFKVSTKIKCGCGYKTMFFLNNREN